MSSPAQPDADDGPDFGDRGFELSVPVPLGDDGEEGPGDLAATDALADPGAEWSEEEGVVEAIEPLRADAEPSDVHADDLPFEDAGERALLAQEAAHEDAHVAAAFRGADAHAEGFGADVPHATKWDDLREAEVGTGFDDGGNDGPQGETWKLDEPPPMQGDDAAGDDDEGVAEPVLPGVPATV